MSTQWVCVPPASAAVSSRSISAAATPCGAAQKSAERRVRRMQRFELAQVGELERRIGAREVRKGRRHPRAGLTVGQHRGYLEPRMLRDEPQQLAGDVAGAAEHERRCALAHAPATFASPTLRSGSRDIR